ncbi:hypothetical protein MKY87_01125 [Paenibacillus sp. FSL R7-0198]|uniref:Uncharacterized protein n=1 Tax=Paenibacillus amylolyticus TaxID=1451 RepID=A0A100VLJ1_PAEAM|nr:MULTISPECIES: hypothetical protein [Paenibacillus]GAS82003.1 unknown protein [Paenibacillus amylolyticus]
MPPVNWANIFFKLAHYCHLKKQDVWQLTLPQLGYYLEQCNEHIEFTIKVSSMSLGGLFGSGVPSNEDSSGGEEETRTDGNYVNGYKVADAEDMSFLAQLL